MHNSSWIVSKTSLLMSTVPEDIKMQEYFSKLLPVPIPFPQQTAWVYRTLVSHIALLRRPFFAMEGKNSLVKAYSILILLAGMLVHGPIRLHYISDILHGNMATKKAERSRQYVGDRATQD